MKKEFLQINLNQHILVKLSAKGIEHWKNHYRRYSFGKPEKKNQYDFINKSKNKDGYSEFQIHDFMFIFGETLFGATTCFETLNVLFDKSEIKTIFLKN